MYNLVLHSRLKIKGPVSSQCKNLLYKVGIYLKLITELKKKMVWLLQLFIVFGKAKQ